jgi:hypothetical protein
MSALAGTSAQADPPTARRTVGSYIWFALMLGGWAAFLSLITFSDATLTTLYDDLRSLPVLVEVLVWFLTFPFTLALTVWESSWESSTRFGFVVCIAIAWSVMFVPRKRPAAKRPKEV